MYSIKPISMCMGLTHLQKTIAYKWGICFKSNSAEYSTRNALSPDKGSKEAFSQILEERDKLINKI